MKTFSIVFIIAILISCNSSQKKKMDSVENDGPVVLSKKQLSDSILMARHNHVQTDILSKNRPGLKTSEAYEIQLGMMEKEIDAGAKHIGWKMGGTATKDAAKFNPSYGYMLDRNLISEKGTIPVGHFPGGSVVVEAEVGLVLKKDMPKGVASMEELVDNIDYIVGTIEIAKVTAISTDASPLGINYVIASGTGHVAAIKGHIKVKAEDFDFENESAKCYINGKLMGEGISSNIFGSPLNALFHLANMLPEKNKFLKAGDLVLSGSVYTNPELNGAGEIRVEFSTLGTITFKSE